MKPTFPSPKLLLGLLLTSFFLLLATVVFAGVHSLFQLLGDARASWAFGWIAAGTGLLFFTSFLLLVFVHVGFSILPELLSPNAAEPSECEQDGLTPPKS